jgi:hypothetical protein
MPQWVELYNSGEGNVSIGGWTITIIDGPWKGPIKIPLGSVIQANQYLVLEGSTSWAQRNNGTALLVNSAGVEMDQTPQLNDEEDNDFTNSRVVDGFDTNTSADWAFMPGSKGRPNGAGLIKP